MHQIENVIISDEVFNCHFECDLEKCKGRCCKDGDLGTPVFAEEVESILKLLPEVSHRLTKKQKSFIKAGLTETHSGNLHIKNAGNNVPCPLSYTDENAVILCSLHTHALENSLEPIDCKPVWCSNYPLVISKPGPNWYINTSILPFCHSKKDAKPILLSFEKNLETFFGKSWVKKLKEKLPVE